MLPESILLDANQTCNNFLDSSCTNTSSSGRGVPSPVLPLRSVRCALPVPSMHPVGNPLWLAAAVAVALAFPARAAPAPTQPEFYDPRILGGEMLNNASRHGGEPLNVIISGRSTPSVLTDAGFLGYAGALGFADECFGFHIGDRQPANLGDGHGWVDEGMVLREDFGSAAIGTCWESVRLTRARMYRQNGPAANSGALFLAVSHERNFLTHHTISPDGYNLGRDLLVARATHTRTVFKGVRYATSVRRLEGLLGVGKEGGDITIDGTVLLLTVTVLPSTRASTPFRPLPPFSHPLALARALLTGFYGAVEERAGELASMVVWVHASWGMRNVWVVW
ncbi:hypothetical protein B0H13DRAFT_1999342 [Mycena leptocephala]|nr:hypothetical protein B0H13DRAFT_1999342 [Mycena leptocephala]